MSKISSLLEMCTHGYEIWRSEVYLICWEIVETHPMSRV